MRVRPSPLFLLSLLGLLAAACSSPEPPPPPPPEPVAAVESVPAQPHFVDAVAIQDAVILGDLVAAQTVARKIAATEPPAGLDPDRVKRIRTAAGAAGAAADLMTASTALGAMATQCSACHSALETPPSFEMPRLPSHDPALKPHMARHEWAVNRLWEALITGSQERWSKGLSALAEETIGPDHITGMDKLPETASEAAQRVHELAAEGLLASDAADRERIYTELVAACGTCHGFLGVGPKGTPAP